MGAYGSPELPPNNSYTYGYGSQKNDKPKGSSCIFNFFKGLLFVAGTFSIVFVVIAFILGSRPSKSVTAQAMASSSVYSQPVYIPPIPAPSAPVPSAPASSAPTVHNKPQISSTQSYYNNAVDEDITKCMTEAEMIRAWAESVVRLSLIKKEKAQFYKDGSKWKISKNKDFYEISSDILFRESPTKRTFCLFYRTSG